MVDENNTQEYNFKILSQERKRQKISQENAATALTLSVVQVNSLENNLEPGFITAHFKEITLKRYAKFLGIDFDKIIPSEIILDDVIKEKKFSEVLEIIKNLVKEFDIGSIIVGDPINMDGSLGPKSQSSRSFIANINFIVLEYDLV